jgi:hypothetical protein
MCRNVTASEIAQIRLEGVAHEANRFPNPGVFQLLLMRPLASGIKKSALAALSLGAASLNIGFCLLVA